MTTENIGILFALLWLGTFACYIVDRRKMARALHAMQEAVVYQSQHQLAQKDALNVLRNQLYTCQQARFDLLAEVAKQHQRLQEMVREAMVRPED